MIVNIRSIDVRAKASSHPKYYTGRNQDYMFEAARDLAREKAGAIVYYVSEQNGVWTFSTDPTDELERRFNYAY